MAATDSGGVNLSDEISVFKCTTCAKKNVVQHTTNYCSDCRKYLCVGCLQIHDEYIDGHTVVNVDDGDQLTSLLTEKCDQHRTHVIEWYCITHDKLACSLCTTLEHSSCSLKHIPESLADLDENPKIKDVPGQLHSALEQLDQVIADLDKHVEDLSDRERQLLLEIEEYTRKILATIEELKRKAKSDVTIKLQQLKSKAQDNKQTCISFKTYVKSCLNDMKSSSKRKAHLFILKKKGDNLAKNIETLCSEAKRIQNRNRFKFIFDRSIEVLVNGSTSLGRCPEKHVKYTVQRNEVIKASVTSDLKSCDITDFCFLEDGKILLADAGNNRLKLLDLSTSSLIDSYDMQGWLRGVACISECRIAVCTFTEDLQIVSLESKLSPESKLYMDYKCYKVAESLGELFVATYKGLHVHKYTGELMRSIGKDKSGKQMFIDIRGVAVDCTGERVYIADMERGLFCTDRSGQLLFKLSQEELGLSGAHGICTDHLGNVFVCGYRSNNVVQVTDDGHVLGDIVSNKDHIVKSQCLCFDDATNRLFVGGVSSDLMVFHLN